MGGGPKHIIGSGDIRVKNNYRPGRWFSVVAFYSEYLAMHGIAPLVVTTAARWNAENQNRQNQYSAKNWDIGGIGH